MIDMVAQEDHVGRLDRVLEVLGDGDLERGGRRQRAQRFDLGAGPLRRAVPQPHLADRADGGVRLDQVRGERAGAHHQQARRIGSGQVGRGQRRVGRGLAQRERGAVDAASGAPVLPSNST